MKKNLGLTIIFVFIVAFFINLLWEMAHSLLYDWNTLPLENNVPFFVVTIFLSTIGDGVYILVIFFINSLIRNNTTWILNPRRFDYIMVSILGVLAAIFIEVKAQISGKWSYNEYMPTIFSIGITPLFQLAFTAVFTFYIVSKIINNKKDLNST